MTEEIGKFEEMFLGKKATLTVSCVAGAVSVCGTVEKPIDSNSYFIGTGVLNIYELELDSVKVTTRSVAFVYKNGARATVRTAL